MAGNKKPRPRRVKSHDAKMAGLIRGIPPRQLLTATEVAAFRAREMATIDAVVAGAACTDVLAMVECTALTQVLLFRDAVARPGMHDVSAESCADALRELTATVAPAVAALRDRQRATGVVICADKAERDALGMLADVAGLSIEMLPRKMHLQAMQRGLNAGCSIAVNGDGE